MKCPNECEYKKISSGLYVPKYFQILEKRKFTWSRIGYLAEFLTVFFALTLLTGRVALQSYWCEYGLSSDLVNTSFVNYSIFSPNTTIACIILAIITVGVIRFFQGSIFDFIDNSNINTAFITGVIAFTLGVIAITIVQTNNLISWPSGTAGLTLGTGFLFSIGGMIIINLAFFKRQEELRTKANVGKTKTKKNPRKNIPFILIRYVFVIAITFLILWLMLDTAQKFGVVDAHIDYDKKPVAALQLDSINGFEDLPFILSPSGQPIIIIKIITQTDELLYAATGFEPDKLLLHIRAIPISRIQDISYSSNITIPFK